MQRVLRKRVLRDLKANFLRYLALGLMVVMGMFIVVSIVGSAETLTNGTKKLSEETNLEDGEFSVFVPLTKAEIEEIKKMDIALEEQFYLDYIRDDEDKSTVRIFKVRKNINQIKYIEGNAPSAEGEIVVEKRYSEEHSIKVGDSFDIAGVNYKVSGIGCVSDYDGPYKNISDTSCNSKYFGLVFMTENDYEAFRKSGKSQKSEEFAYAYKLGSATDKELKDYLKKIKISADQIDDEFFKEYWDRTGGVTEDLKQAVVDLRDATGEVKDALNELSENNEDLNGATGDILDTFIEQAEASINAYGLNLSLNENNFEAELDKLINDENYAMLKDALVDVKGQLKDLKDYKEGVYAYTDAVVEIADGTSEMEDGVAELDEAVTDAVKELDISISNLTMFLKRSDNLRIFATKADKAVDISVGLLAGVIFLILMAYVISVFVVHSIESESSIIGTLYSMGVTKNDLIVHYITLPAIVTTISGLIGVFTAAAGLLAPMIAESSYSYFSIPRFEFNVPTYLWIYGVVIPPVLSVIVNVIVINSKLNRTALSLIRNEKKRGKEKHINLKNMNFVTAFRIRQMIREKRSALTVVFGMFIALLVFMMGVDCYIMCTNLEKDYEKDTKFEYMYTLKYPEKEAPEESHPAYAYSCKKKALGYNFDVTILGIKEDNPYFDLKTTKSKEKVVISSAMAQKFELKEGDDFVVSDEEKEIKYAFSVEEIADYSIGFYIFMDLDTMREMFGESKDYYNTLFSDKALDIDPGRLYATTSREDILNGSKVFVDLMMPMIYVLSIASSLIFCVVMYLMMKVMIDRSAMNISLMKIFGYRRKEVKKLYLDGNFYIIVVGAAICIPLSKFVMDKCYPYMISNVGCGSNLTGPMEVFFIIYAVIIALYFVINALLVRKIDKYTPAEVLKNRE